MPLSPKVVREVTFDKAPFGRRGYHEDQVDAFLDRIEEALSGETPMTSTEIRKVIFDAAPLVKRGYNEEQVDKFLDTIAVELEARERAKIGQRVPIAAPRKPESVTTPAPPLAPHEIIDPTVPFLPLPPAPPNQKGYRAVDVERLAHLLTRAANEKEGGPTAKQIANMPLALTIFDGQGYHPAAVDTVVAAWVDELRHRRTRT